MSHGLICLDCRKYITNVGSRCNCSWPTPSQNGKTADPNCVIMLSVIRQNFKGLITELLVHLDSSDESFKTLKQRFLAETGDADLDLNNIDSPQFMKWLAFSASQREQVTQLLRRLL